MTLLDLENKIKNIYYKTAETEAKIKQEYERYSSPEAKNIYAQKLIDDKLAECKDRVLTYRNAQKGNIEFEYKNLLEGLKPNQEVINSLEYQTRLSNTLNLLALSKGDINTNQLDQLDFICEAMDENTLNIIKDAYRDNVLLGKYIEDNSIATKIEEANWTRDTGKRALDFENESYMNRLARWDIENKFGVEEE